MVNRLLNKHLIGLLDMTALMVIANGSHTQAECIELVFELGQAAEVYRSFYTLLGCPAGIERQRKDEDQAM